MPTLVRFLTIIAIIVGLVYGAMWALVLTVKPRRGEMTERVPAERLNPAPAPAPAAPGSASRSEP